MKIITELLYFNDPWNPKAGNVGTTPNWSGGAASASLKNIDAALWPAGSVILSEAQWAVDWIPQTVGSGAQLVWLDDTTNVLTVLAQISGARFSPDRINAPNPDGAYVAQQLSPFFNGGKNGQLGWQTWGDGVTPGLFYSCRVLLVFST